MNVKSKITIKAREILGTRIRRADPYWQKISSLCEAYGEGQVVEAFEEWALTKVGVLILNWDAFGDFIRVADGLLTHEVVLKPSPDASKVVAEITLISGGTVIPDKKQSLMITQWLEPYTYTSAEIIAAFRTFYGQVEGDDRGIKFASRDFCEKGIELMALARFHKQCALKPEKLLERQRQQKMDRATMGAEPADEKGEFPQ
jgi:hypothetical protein